MDAVEHRGRNDKCTVGIVSCRTDVIPFFIKRGYKESILYVKLIYSLYSIIYLPHFAFRISLTCYQKVGKDMVKRNAAASS